MALTPFFRAPRLSSAATLKRIAVKGRVFAKRRAEIEREGEVLRRRIDELTQLCRVPGTAVGDAVALRAPSERLAELERRLEKLVGEDTMVAGFEADLERASEAEFEANRARRAKARTRSETAPSTCGPVAPSGYGRSGVGRSIVAEANGGASVDRYDEELRLFLGSDGLRGGDPSPRRIVRALKGEFDPLFERLISFVEVPGLAHLAVLSERVQEAVPIRSDDVPPACLGLPAAEAFSGHVFSADAYSDLQEERSAAEFLLRVARHAPRRRP